MQQLGTHMDDTRGGENEANGAQHNAGAVATPHKALGFKHVREGGWEVIGLRERHLPHIARRQVDRNDLLVNPPIVQGNNALNVQVGLCEVGDWAAQPRARNTDKENLLVDVQLWLVSSTVVKDKSDLASAKGGEGSGGQKVIKLHLRHRGEGNGCATGGPIGAGPRQVEELPGLGEGDRPLAASVTDCEVASFVRGTSGHGDGADIKSSAHLDRQKLG
mmetsp:Transcript_13486/g.34432  ORF Transcript_13486/g.34432 Transcript_13486/m.34432 type:complete len:219 (+) Transcript_13486:426-1082(+)